MAFFKKIFIKLFQFKIYRRIMISFGLMFIATVTLLSCLLFYLFSSSATGEISNTSRQMLAQTSYASEVIYAQVTNISSQLMNDNNIITFFYSREIDKTVNYYISSQLTRIQNIYPFIRSIGVYNLQNGLNIDTEGIPIETSVLRGNNKYIEFFPRRVTIQNYDRRTSYELITFVIFPDFSLAKASSLAIVINIDQSYILNTASSISGISPGSSTFVMDSGGLILSHTDAGSFMRDLSGQSHISRILNEKKDQGSFVSKIDDKKYLVTFVKSSKVNWYFVSIRQYDQLLGNIYELRNIVLNISLFLIVLGLIVSFFLTGVIYNPIKALIEKAGKAESSIKSSSHMLRENFILNMLRGNLAQMDAPQEVPEEIRSRFSSPYHCLIVFKIDNYQRFKQDIPEKDQFLFRFAISNIAQELLLKHFQNETAAPEKDEVAVLAHLSDRCLPQEIYLTLVEVQEAVRNYFNLTVSVCIGEVLYSVNDISASYKALQEFCKYRLFYGHECIMDPEKLRAHASRSLLYPYDLEKKLVDALHLGSSKLVQKYADEFTNYIYAANYSQAVNYSNQLILSIMKHSNNMLDMHEDSFKSYFDVINLINQAEVLQDISHVITGLGFRICRLVEEKNNSLIMQKSRKTVDDVRSYVLQNYGNPNLSLEMVADVVELSPGYLGKLFKNIAALSFNEYLNNIRLEKARELLCETSEPASKICEKVGIFNITYFSTLFKKAYGMTPSQYRKM